MSRAMTDLINFNKNIYLNLLVEQETLIEAIQNTDVNRMYLLLPKLNNLDSWMEIKQWKPVLDWCKGHDLEPSTSLKATHEQWQKKYNLLKTDLPKLYRAISSFRAETCLYYKTHLLKSLELVVKLHSMAVELTDYCNNNYAKGKLKSLGDKVDEYEEEYEELIKPPVSTNPPTGDIKIFDCSTVKSWSDFELKCKNLWTGNTQLREAHKAAVTEFLTPSLDAEAPVVLSNDQKFNKLNSFFLCELFADDLITFKQSDDYVSGSDYNGGYSVEYKVNDGVKWIVHIHCDRDGIVLKSHLKKTTDRYKIGKSINLSKETLEKVGLGLEH